MSERKQWEYLSVTLDDVSERDDVFEGGAVELLNEHGANGWEAVLVARNNRTSHTVLMKRERIAAPSE